MLAMSITSILIALIILNSFDYILTLMCVSAGLQEMNPIMASIINNIYAYTAVKLILPTIVFSIVILWYKSKRELFEKSKFYGVCKAMLEVVVIAYFLIVINNLYSLFWVVWR